MPTDAERIEMRGHRTVTSREGHFLEFAKMNCLGTIHGNLIDRSALNSCCGTYSDRG
jgi:hypothetical protein